MNAKLWDKLPMITLADEEVRQLYFSTAKCRELAHRLGYDSTSALLAGLGAPKEGVKPVDVIDFLPHALFCGLAYQNGDTPLTFEEVDALIPIGRINELGVEVFAAFQGFSREGAAAFMKTIDLNKLRNLPQEPSSGLTLISETSASPESNLDLPPTNTGN